MKCLFTDSYDRSCFRWGRLSGKLRFTAAAYRYGDCHFRKVIERDPGSGKLIKGRWRSLESKRIDRNTTWLQRRRRKSLQGNDGTRRRTSDSCSLGTIVWHRTSESLLIVGRQVLVLGHNVFVCFETSRSSTANTANRRRR